MPFSKLPKLWRRGIRKQRAVTLVSYTSTSDLPSLFEETHKYVKNESIVTSSVEIDIDELFDEKNFTFFEIGKDLNSEDCC